MKALYVGCFRFHNQVGQEGDVHEREGLFGLQGTYGEHTGAQASRNQNGVTNLLHGWSEEAQAFKRDHLREAMEGKSSPVMLAVAGAILVGQTFTDLAPAGPWASESFTRGVLGLAGFVCLYLSWFSLTFGKLGVAPTVNLWKHPEKSWLNVVLFGLGCLVATRLILLFDTGNIFPVPSGLILSLIGTLAVMNGLYVWAITKGPLLEEE